MWSADSPRLVGENADHIRVLAEAGSDLPPILVHRPTMRVIDGMHRLRATVLRGEREIAVRFLDGYESDVFVVAVQANTTHGLPLTRADRNAAATRIIQSHPQWSDRMIASFAGLSPKTVGSIRRRLGDDLPAAPVRIGRDGRTRPVDSSVARAATGEFIRTHPDATLRQIAGAAGVSRSTARDVRRRLAEGETGDGAAVVAGVRAGAGRHLQSQSQRQPKGVPGAPDASGAPGLSVVGEVPVGASTAARSALAVSVSARVTADAAAAVDTAHTTDAPVSSGARTTTTTPAETGSAADLIPILKRDPSIRFTDSGRLLLRLLDAATLPPDEWSRLIESVPAHCVDMVANVARACGEVWLNVAQEVDSRAAQR
ncbi:ParB N-terminal domain-containing protein [Streptomyces sp. SID10115]|uniref:ParB/RepB/Spo0J family partition protein n=1 Tax=Streptomyces sp. SID10115 TaxID=2706016 RepID=UPI0013698811|nr:ParB/RepB/Spo0J family partition protein [Streptomyces sp. SID10115]MYZ17342.1 ParB N-terminal domain-containing protein [Streptomyces sp. SID337]NDZ85881.1 ParB N-terminal domain-containing protein [Streptomyces sp. SID10115]NDZ99867.1 ParB N-terminal domain-containing protein [Streptomyces sp. SID10116]